MIAAVVLAGGAGRRMGGVDKASLRVAGETMLDRVLGAAAPVSDRLVVVGPVRPTVVPGVAFVQEEIADGGPVPAVAAGVGAAPGAEVVLVLAVDLPLLRPPHLRQLIANLTSHPDSGAAAALDHRGQPNPLLAAYRVDSLAAALVPGRAGPGSPAAHLLPPDPVLVDLGSAATLNVNRPPDLARAAALLSVEE